MNIESNKYEVAHGKAPRGTALWGFIGPEGQFVLAPMPMPLTKAKAWLAKELKAVGLDRRQCTWQVAP